MVFLLIVPLNTFSEYIEFGVYDYPRRYGSTGSPRTAFYYLTTNGFLLPHHERCKCESMRSNVSGLPYDSQTVGATIGRPQVSDGIASHYD
jgi:hypothetical protein